MNSDLWDTVCLHWNASQLCSVQILENLKFKTNIQLNRTIKDGGCVNFQVKKVIMEDGIKLLIIKNHLYMKRNLDL